MKTDVCIIGGGLAGLTAGITLQKKGIKTTIFSKGAPGLSFSSGNIDVYRGILWKEKIDDMVPESHPYKKTGQKMLAQSLAFFQSIYGNDLIENCGDSIVLTPFGKVLEDVDFIQESMSIEKKKYKKTAILKIPGYGDFPYTLFRDRLVESKYFDDINILSLGIKIPYRFFLIRTKNVSDYITRKDIWKKLLHEIKGYKDSYDLLLIPGFLPADTRYHEYYEQIKNTTDNKIREVASSPPSVPGTRMYNRLITEYRNSGGSYEKNRSVTGFKQSGSFIKEVIVENKKEPVAADYFILASGTFFTGGLTSRIHHVEEPVFKADVDFIHDTSQWSDARFYQYSNHKFLSFGVKTDENLRVLKDNEIIKNLYAAGALLSGFNPLSEKSAGGVSIATAYTAANNIERSL